tara:strand:- start:624 stop:1685 length:1062 start_codon:yes stop_codon:yes gene_type:complete
MRKLNRYIASSVIASITLALMVILSLDLIGALINEVEEVEGNYTYTEVVIYLSLTLPGRIYNYIPFSALVGCLVGLGLLASSSELTVMRAAGVSVKRITWMTLRASLVFIGLAIFLGEMIIPYTDQMAESRRALAQGDTRALQSDRGLWNREGDDFVHINAVQPNGKLFGVTRYQFSSQGRMFEASFTEQAIFQGEYWEEEGVEVSSFTGDRIVKETYNSRRWDTDLTPDLLNVLVLEPEALSIQSLYSYASYLDSQQRDSGQYWLAFWQKVFQPLVTASLVLIAISFVFGPLRQVTLGHRIFTGLVFGIVFRTIQDLLGPSSLVFGFPPLIAVLLPLLLCVGIGTLLLRRAN